MRTREKFGLESTACVLHLKPRMQMSFPRKIKKSKGKKAENKPWMVSSKTITKEDQEMDELKGNDGREAKRKRLEKKGVVSYIKLLNCSKHQGNLRTKKKMPVEYGS